MKIFEFFSKLFFPPKCVFCRRILEEYGVCDKCKVSLPYRRPAESKDKVMFVDEIYSCFKYEGDVKNAIVRYKFGGMACYADDFSKYLADCVRENLAGKFDIISWVPLSKKRLRSRGYDQARLLAEGVCKRLGLTAVRTLNKCRNAAPQSRQNDPSERMANILGAYEVCCDDVQGKRIIIIDDVMTTGSTTSECARVLKTAGADSVIVLTLAKTKKRKKQLKN